MTIEVSNRVKKIKPSPTLAASARAAELKAAGRDIISLSVGEPDFDTPDHIRAAGIAAIQAGKTRYTAVDGVPSLKQAIQEKFKRENQLDYALSQIIVSCGAKHSLYNIVEAIINPGDEVIIPAPYWVSYPDMVKLADGVPVILPTTIKDHYKISPEQLEAAISTNTRFLFLNSPSNPSGKAYTKAELKALGVVLRAHPHVLIVSDDIYEHTLWAKEPFCNIVMACPDLYERTLVVNGASKTYAMTGWRIGYAAGATKIIHEMEKVQSQSTSNPCSISQAAAEAALRGDQTCIKTMTDAFKRRHDLVFKALQSMDDVACIPSDGTFYALPDISAVLKKSKHIKDDIAFAEYLVNEVGVALVPGSAFGAPGCIRISYATRDDILIDALERIQKAIHKLTA